MSVKRTFPFYEVAQKYLNLNICGKQTSKQLHFSLYLKCLKESWMANGLLNEEIRFLLKLLSRLEMAC